MNKTELDVILTCSEKKISSQRELSTLLNISLGNINSIISRLRKEHYIDDSFNVTNKSYSMFNKTKPCNAIILAAGIGNRMYPINIDCPKALIEINGKRIIEQQIEFLIDKGIKEIIIVVGYQKEKFDYLIDKYNVELIFNEHYYDYNSFYSLYKVKDRISNTYLISSDLWLLENPFNSSEIYSWRMFGKKSSNDSSVRSMKNGRILASRGKGDSVYGISYICSDVSKNIVNELNMMYAEDDFINLNWDIIFQKIKYNNIYAKYFDDKKICVISSYSQLVSLDKNSSSLNIESLNIIKNVFRINVDEISNIIPLKKGMTNKSFIFEVDGIKYILRIPGECTNELINRSNEYEVYNVINGKNICDDVIYINAKTGYKITKYIENSRTCDVNSRSDLEKCMKFLREFHNKNFKVKHSFNLFEQIDYYEKLRGPIKSVYCDYKMTKSNVFLLKKFIDANIHKKTLAHIDSICDNFLIFKNSENSEEIRLIDFEYSGMQDPDIDIAMFCIYALYDKKNIDDLIDIYYENCCDCITRIKIYCYIACCGLLWSNWCEYKKIYGIEFGEYSIKQYRYAKDYYKIAIEMMKEIDYE